MASASKTVIPKKVLPIDGLMGLPITNARFAQKANTNALMQQELVKLGNETCNKSGNNIRGFFCCSEKQRCNVCLESTQGKPFIFISILLFPCYHLRNNGTIGKETGLFSTN